MTCNAPELIALRKGRRRQKKTEEDEQKERDQMEARRRRIASALTCTSMSELKNWLNFQNVSTTLMMYLYMHLSFPGKYPTRDQVDTEYVEYSSGEETW